MNKREIIGQMAKEKVIENITKKYFTNYKDDLNQYIYLYLLQMDDDKFMEIYNKGQINYFLVGIIRHQVISTTSYHVKTNIAKAGILELKDAVPVYEETYNYLDDDTPPHQLEDRVDAALSALSQQDREIILIQKVCYQDRKPLIDNFLSKYNLKYEQYQLLLPQAKQRFAKLLNIQLTYKTKYNKRRTRQVEQYDRDMNLIKVWNTAVEAATELHLKVHGIYKVCQRQRDTYNGYIWRYVKN